LPVPELDVSVPLPIRVLIVDKHTAVRQALALCLAAYDDLCLAGEAASGDEAIRQCACVHPDVVLLDVTLPDMPGLSAATAIRKTWSPSAVVAMCSFQEERSVREVVASAATGYLLKNVSADELARAIRSAHAGRSGLPAELSA
jgi:two-component system, NarL family, response regulator LiaR